MFECGLNDEYLGNARKNEYTQISYLIFYLNMRSSRLKQSGAIFDLS